MALHTHTRSWSRFGGGQHRAGSGAPVSPLAHRRRVLTVGLGLLWLLDAALQYQPYMFGPSFPAQIIAPAGQGSPGWVHGPVTWAAQLLSAAPALNGLFATVQLAIAVGLLFRRTSRVALAASIAWSLQVWWLGEGLGGVLAGPVSPLAGLPGGAVLYTLIAVLLWPVTRPSAASVAAASPLRATGAEPAWLALWAAWAFESLRPANLTPQAWHDLIAGMAAGEPGPIAHLNTAAAGLFAQHGGAAAIGLAAACTLIGLSVLLPAATRPGLAAAIILALAIWVIAEDFGQIFTGTATDPNTGLPLILLALCYWPIPCPARDHADGGHPAGTVAPATGEPH